MTERLIGSLVLRGRLVPSISNCWLACGNRGSMTHLSGNSRPTLDVRHVLEVDFGWRTDGCLSRYGHCLYFPLGTYVCAYFEVTRLATAMHVGAVTISDVSEASGDVGFVVSTCVL